MNNKKSEIQISVNTALQASITPIGIDFEMNRLRLGENYCCIFAITDYPSECDYGWLSKLTNIPGTIVSINSEPIDNGEAVTKSLRKSVCIVDRLPVQRILANVSAARKLLTTRKR